MANTYALYLTALLLTRTNATNTKKHHYPTRKAKRNHFKQFKRARANPQRANRHIYTAKDMRSW